MHQRKAKGLYADKFSCQLDTGEKLHKKIKATIEKCPITLAYRAFS